MVSRAIDSGLKNFVNPFFEDLLTGLVLFAFGLRRAVIDSYAVTVHITNSSARLTLGMKGIKCFIHHPGDAVNVCEGGSDRLAPS